MEPARRMHPRLSFTGRPAPLLETGHRTYEILDLSPAGLRFRCSTASGVTIGDLLRATIRFPADRAIEVEGRVLRVSGMEAAVQLDQGHERLATTAPMGAATPRRTGLIW